MIWAGWTFRAPISAKSPKFLESSPTRPKLASLRDPPASDRARPFATGRRHHQHLSRHRRGNPTTRNLGALEGPRRHEGQGMKGKVIQLKRPKTTASAQSISALARELKLPRSTVRSRLARGWQPPGPEGQEREEQPKASSPASPPPSPPPSP